VCIWCWAAPVGVEEEDRGRLVGDWSWAAEVDKNRERSSSLVFGFGAQISDMSVLLPRFPLKATRAMVMSGSGSY
jgi:hypothetical protein